jgi:hypothetical protein
MHLCFYAPDPLHVIWEWSAMTPQLKYGLIVLFILLDVSVVVYLFSGNPTQPDKQAAAPQVVTPQPAQKPLPQQPERPAEPPAQPAVQQPHPQKPEYPPPVYESAPKQPPKAINKPPVQKSAPQQPPLSGGIPPPPPNPYDNEVIIRCNIKAAIYKEKFLNYWPQQLAASLGNERMSAQVAQQYREYRSQWNEEKRYCPVSWLPPFGSDIEELANRKDCDTRGANYGHAFEALSRMSPIERAQFFSAPYYRENGVQTVDAFTRWFQQLKQRCSNELTGGWRTPFDENIIYQMTSR